MDGSAEVDAPINQIPGLGASYQHAMRDPGQSIEDARANMCRFIAENLALYSKYMKWGDKYLAYNFLGRAIHPIMDSTSPVHRGFQEWRMIEDGMKHGNAHGSEEGLDALSPALLKENIDLIHALLSGDASCPCGKY